jgi:hypothetical protein
MNRLIAFLKNENNLSIARLKQLYRLLSKKTHPDLVKGAPEQFVRLRKDYEEALQILRSHGPANMGISGGNRDPGKNVREQVLSGLYLYALKFFSSESKAAILRLIEAAYPYDSRIHELLKSYYAEFFRQFHAWQHDGDVYYTHNLFIASIKQLAYHSSFGMPRHRKLLHEYLDDLRRRALKLEPKQARILQSLADWLEDEGEKPRIQII